MSKLKQRFIEDLELHGYSKRTVEMYARAVRQLEDHCKKPAEEVSEEEVRQYFLYNRNDRKWSRTASTIALCGIKFFFEKFQSIIYIHFQDLRNIFSFPLDI